MEHNSLERDDLLGLLAQVGLDEGPHILCKDPKQLNPIRVEVPGVEDYCLSARPFILFHRVVRRLVLEVEAVPAARRVNGNGEALGDLIELPDRTSTFRKDL